MATLNLDKEKAFTISYHSHLKRLQSICPDDIMVYTKITLPFALLNGLCFHELVFHPLSLSKHKSYDQPDLSSESIKQTLEEIIIYEVSATGTEGKLSLEQLNKVIECFRSLALKKSLVLK